MAAALGKEVEADRGSEGEEWGGGTQRALESLQSVGLVSEVP